MVMKRDEIANSNVREVVNRLRISGYPAPMEIKATKLNSAQEDIIGEFSVIAKAKEEAALEKKCREARPGNELWNFRMRMRALFQKAVQNDMIHLGIIQRHARTYGAVPDHESSHNWKYFILPDNDTWLCWECGSEIQAITQSQSVHFAEFALAGGGEVRHKTIPYCPKCETKPSDRGIIRETVGESILNDMY